MFKRKKTAMSMSRVIPAILTAFLFLSCGTNTKDTESLFTPYYPETINVHEDSDFLYPSYVFDMEAFPTITLNVSLDEWNTLLTNMDNNWRNEEMVHADFTFEKDGNVEMMSNIGIRIRGATSRKRPELPWGALHDAEDPDYQHAHFKISFREFERGTRFYGLRGINLKWFKDDSDYVREVYNYDLFRRFGVWTAPRASYTRLYINIEGDDEPAYFGVYMMFEPLDSEWANARFTDGEDGFLWKSSWGANLKNFYTAKSFGCEDIDPMDEDNSFRPTYDLKTSKSRLDTEAIPLLQNFIYQLNKLEGEEFETWIAQAFDVDLFLKTLSVHVLVGMWDDYWMNNGNNYYLYFDTANKAYFVPYDYDNSLGVSMLLFCDNTGTQSVLNYGDLDKSTLLVSKILAIPEYLTDYTNYIYQLLDPANELFDFDASTNRIIAWQTMVEPYIDNDTEEDVNLYDWSYTDWADVDYYQLLHGDNSGNAVTRPGANYFLTRARSVIEELGFDLPIKDGEVYDVFPTAADIFFENEYYDPDLTYENTEITEETVIFRVANEEDWVLYLCGGFNGWGGGTPVYQFTNTSETGIYAVEVPKIFVPDWTGYMFYDADNEVWFTDPGAKYNSGPNWYTPILIYDDE